MGGMKRCTKFFALSGVLGLASLVGIGSVHAQLKFQTTQPVEFTFNPTLSLNVSGDLVVNNLTAGSNADSNEIIVAVNTNVASGYYLTATAGTPPTTTNLINTSNSSYIFTSLATNASLDDMSNANDNEWGYAFKVGSNAYSNYSGLPLDSYDSGETGAKLINTTKPANNQTVTFKIGAKAAASQPSGEYTNVVNFYAVTAPLPKTADINDLEYMQELASFSTAEKTAVIASMIQDQQYQLQDQRDGKTYYVAKLPDGNIWMTENLDFDIDSTKTYTPADTDIPANWTPSLSTYQEGDTTWNTSDTTPESYDPGDLCWNGTIDNSGSYEGTLDTMTILCTDDEADLHYSIGNYYNWTAAVAMNDSSSYTTDLQDVDQSICPAGWRLPVYEGPKSYTNLLSNGITTGTSGNIHLAPYYLFYGGAWGGYSLGVAGGGAYWYGVVEDRDDAYFLSFDAGGSDYWYPQTIDDRFGGFPVRCVVR